MASVESEPTVHIIHEPKVYLLGRQVVDEEALARFSPTMRSASGRPIPRSAARS